MEKECKTTMKMRKNALRICCLLLSLMMTVGMLPAAALAAEPTVITDISLTEAPAPAAGAVCLLSAEAETEDFEVEEVAVYDITGGTEEPVAEAAVFVGGKTYRVEILVAAKADFAFEAPENMTAKINGQEAEIEADEEDDTKRWIRLEVAVSLPAPADELQTEENQTEPQETGLTVTPATAEAEKGGTLQLTANGTVTWSVTGGASAQTQVDAAGLLTVGADETADTLTVVATAADDNTKTASAVITVKAPAAAEYTLTYDGNGEGDVTGVPAAQTQADATFALSQEQPAQEGFAFQGWALDPNAETAMTETSVTAPGETRTVTVYAVWAKTSGEHTHTPGKVDAVPATCTEDGQIEHWKCTDPACGKLFSDEAGTTEITDVVVPASHNLTDVTALEPTYTTDGMKAHKCCTVCGKLFVDGTEVEEADLVIPKLITVVGDCANVSAAAMEKATLLGNVSLNLNSETFVGDAAGEIHSVMMPTSGLEKAVTLVIEMADGTVEINQTALADITEQANCSFVTLFLNQLETTDLSLLQRNALRTYDIVRVVDFFLVDCDGKEIPPASTEGYTSGSIKLLLSNITKTKNSIYYKYVPDNADEKSDLKGLTGTYSSANKLATMHLTYPGIQAVVRLKADPSNPSTGDNSNIYLWMGLMGGSAVVLAAAITVAALKKRKKR